MPICPYSVFYIIQAKAAQRRAHQRSPLESSCPQGGCYLCPTHHHHGVRLEVPFYQRDTDGGRQRRCGRQHVEDSRRRRYRAGRLPGEHQKNRRNQNNLLAPEHPQKATIILAGQPQVRHVSAGSAHHHQRQARSTQRPKHLYPDGTISSFRVSKRKPRSCRSGLFLCLVVFYRPGSLSPCSTRVARPIQR